MSIEIDRNLLSQIVIILCATIGGWMKLVDPPLQEIRKLEAEMAARQTDSPPVSVTTVDAMAARVNDVHARIDEIRSRNELGRNSTLLYGLIMDIAEDHGVEVRQLQPGGDRRQNADETITVSRIDLTVRGDYERVASFLQGVTAIDGFVRPANLKVSSAHEEGRAYVLAQFTCDVLEFNLDGALAHLAGKADDDRS